jgi:uncharacterized protein YgiM (DUF1202 family)
MRSWRSFLIIFVSLLLVGAVWLTTRQVTAQPAAQDGVAVSDATCISTLNALWTTASDACIGKPDGYICNGGSAPQIEPGGAVSSALAPVGALVDAQTVNALHTSVLSTTGVGVMWLRIAAPLQVTALLLGDVSLRNVTPADFPAWQSMVVETGAETTVPCAAVPQNALIVQSTGDSAASVVVNGASIHLSGTVLVRTDSADTLFISLSGQSSVIALGQEQALWTGEQLTVPYTPGDFSRPAGVPTQSQPLDVGLLANIPVALLDRPVLLPQPGYVETEGAVNLRTAPNTDAPILVQVPAGQVMSVLGRNTAGDWYHVRLDSGATGWMLAHLLRRNVGTIKAIYEATPLPPQRYGDLGHIGKVQAPAGVNLRNGPDVGFPVIGVLTDGTQVNLLARSPYSPWVKVESGGVTGWLALITLNTEAYIDALPVDNDVPPPPPPTTVPGSFGNAFPDPQGSSGGG